MKKRSCSSHGSDKSLEAPSFRKDKKLISFDFKNNIQPFIGHNGPPKQQVIKQLKREKRMKTNPAPLNHSASSDKQHQISQLRVVRSRKGKIPSNSKSTFNESLFFLGCCPDEEKPENKPENPVKNKESPQSEEEDQEITAVVNSCLRVVTQDTEYSSGPCSAWNTPMSSTPTGMSMGLPMMHSQAYNGYYNYNYNMMLRSPPLGSGRNRRTISTEESKDFVIEKNKVMVDGRTTIMIRHIPNKYTQEMLLELFEKNHKKKFDFFYLPIDYNNNCNVGYAFLNFIHTKFITDFYDEFHRRKWNKFNSTKVCQVCYARIQGTAQLENHFEHSNVLQQRERKFRPLIGLRSLQDNISSLVERQQEEEKKYNE